MPRPRSWENTDMSLFVITDGPATYISCVNVTEVAWGLDNTFCPYCVELRRFEEGRCSDCGKMQVLFPGLAGPATVRLAGLMPDASDLFHVKSGEAMEVCRGWPGDMRQYQPARVVLRLTKCKVIQRIIPNFVRYWGDAVAGGIFVLLEIACIAEVVLPEEGEDE